MKHMGFGLVLTILLAPFLSGCNFGMQGSSTLLIPLTNTESRDIGTTYDWSDFMPSFSEVEVVIRQAGTELFRNTFQNPPGTLTVSLPHTGDFEVEIRAIPDWTATSARVTPEQLPALPTLAREYIASGSVSNLANNQTATVRLRLQVSKTVVLGPNTNVSPYRLRWAEAINASDPQLFNMATGTTLNSGAYFRFDRYGRLYTTVVVDEGNLANYGTAWANPAFTVNTSSGLITWNSNLVCPAYDTLNNAAYYYVYDSPGSLHRVHNGIEQPVSIGSDGYYLLDWYSSQRGIIIADNSGNLYLTMMYSEDTVFVRATVDTSGANPTLVVSQSIPLYELGIDGLYIQDLLFQDSALYLAVAEGETGYFLKIQPDTLSLATLPTPTEALVPRRFLGLQRGKLVFLNAPQDWSTIAVESVRSYDLTSGNVEIGYSIASSTATDFVNMYYC